MGGMEGIKPVLQGLAHLERIQQETQQRPEAMAGLNSLKQADRARHALESVAGVVKDDAAPSLTEEKERDLPDRERRRRPRQEDGEDAEGSDIMEHVDIIV